MLPIGGGGEHSGEQGCNAPKAKGAWRTSPSSRRRAYAGSPAVSSPRAVPQAPRSPCDGRSQLATAPCEPGDEQEGTWPRDQLMRMDARFCERLERAIARGKEHACMESIQDTKGRPRP